MNDDIRDEFEFNEGSVEELLKHSLEMRSGKAPIVMVVVGGDTMGTLERNRILQHAAGKGIRVIFPTGDMDRRLNEGFEARFLADIDLEELIQKLPKDFFEPRTDPHIGVTECVQIEQFGESRVSHMERGGFLGGKRGKGKNVSFFNNGGKRGRR